MASTGQASQGLLNRVLRADAAGSAGQKLFEQSHIALAALTPLAIFSSDGTALQRVTDVALGVAIPVHSHIAINSVLSDYVPKSVMGASRVGALGVTAITLLGFAKLNLMGPGITPTVKKLWRKDPK